MDQSTLDAYLRRLGIGRPRRTDAGTLRVLQERHLVSVPFENMHIRSGKPTALGPAVIDKIAHRHRGGTCIELASAFEQLLRTLGYPEVTVLGGRIFHAGRFMAPVVHYVLKVETPEPWLVDVGFLRGSRYPLRFDVRTPQQDPEGVFQLADTDGGGIELRRDGVPQYRLDPTPLRFEDFPPTWWAWTLPELPMSHLLVASILDATGRTTMVDQRRLLEVSGGRTSERILDGAAEVLEVYRSRFGIALDELPAPGPGPEEDDPVVLEQYRAWFRAQYGDPEVSPVAGGFPMR
ncbi:arylamine N-acetyltransferase family protein [Streptomyces decoyicus]|uniref:arylamine N-acetyltransferase family protein n=1 Tax=Streptomyces decoyicus TaxID=249567 RepID=UPI00069FEE7A|nr:arylamine N-acetyltransferase [Streptomyces decoyicus]QZY16381.1 arylamine N-acetyltransferase [Streptomyces decoyicus]